MLYEITIWKRSAGAPQLAATHHELGHLSRIRELARTLLRGFPDVGPAHVVRVCEAHNGREVFSWKLDPRI